jgi:prepilin-type processing-associated H-X9-DG protein
VWRWVLNPYIQRNGTSTYGANAVNNSILICPTTRIGPTSYGYNVQHFAPSWVQAPSGDWNTAGVSMAAINAPANLVMIGEAAKSGATVTDPFYTDGQSNCNNRTGVGAADPAACGPFRFKPETWKKDPGIPADPVWGACVDWDMAMPGDGRGEWNQAATGNGSRRPFFPHSNMGNFVFADGHAKAIQAGKLAARIGTQDDIWHNNNN